MQTQPVHPTSLRLPTDLKAKLKDRAATNRRSLTGEIIATLEKAMAVDPQEAAQ